mmetsp:Transcript_28707/g.61998  ORF Transcript_28707/g.61998 Transcript_28707/m.61998 type:complete len:287 (+) Transcript_28707:318-1178(+)
MDRPERSAPYTPESRPAHVLTAAHHWQSAVDESLHTEGTHHITLKSILYHSLSNRNFVLLMVAFGLGYGAVNAFTTLINQILLPIGYSDDEIGYIGAAMGLGIIGSLVVGAIMDATKRFVLILKVCGVTAAVFLGVFVVVLYATSKTPAVLAALVLGAFAFASVPLVPLCIEVGVETLYPLPESVPTSFLWLSGNLLGLIQVVSANAMQVGCHANPVKPGQDCHPTSMFHAMLFLSLGYLVAVLSLLCFNGKMRRMMFEQRAQQQHIVPDHDNTDLLTPLPGRDME